MVASVGGRQRSLGSSGWQPYSDCLQVGVGGAGPHMEINDIILIYIKFTLVQFRVKDMTHKCNFKLIVLASKKFRKLLMEALFI